jgi:hypothetical protein
MNTNNIPTEKIYRISDSKLDAIAAIADVLKSAQMRVAIFDETPITLREREYARPANIEIMRQLLMGNRERRIRIALHEVSGIESEAPRLMNLMSQFSTQLFIQRTTGAAREVQDVMLIADDHSIWRKPVASHPRSILTMSDQADVAPYLERFEEIWQLTEHAVSSRGTGL